MVLDEGVDGGQRGTRPPEGQSTDSMASANIYVRDVSCESLKRLLKCNSGFASVGLELERVFLRRNFVEKLDKPLCPRRGICLTGLN